MTTKRNTNTEFVIQSWFLKPQKVMLHLYYIVNQGSIIPNKKCYQLNRAYGTKAHSFIICIINKLSFCYLTCICVDYFFFFMFMCMFTPLNMNTLNVFFRTVSSIICNMQYTQLFLPLLIFRVQGQTLQGIYFYHRIIESKQ